MLDFESNFLTEQVHQYGGPVHVQHQAVQTCKTRGLLAQNDELRWQLCMPALVRAIQLL